MYPEDDSVFYHEFNEPIIRPGVNRVPGWYYMYNGYIFGPYPTKAEANTALWLEHVEEDERRSAYRQLVLKEF